MLTGGRRGRRATVALEMAVVLPTIMALFIGMFDLVDGLSAWRNTRAASAAIAEAATNLAVQTTTLASPYTGQNLITAAQAFDASTAIHAYLPGLPSGASNKFAVTLTSVVFSSAAKNEDGGCTSPAYLVNGSCYTANVAWSISLGTGTTVHGFTQTRACGTLLPVAVGVHSTLTNLPQGLFGPYSLLIADVQYTFTPSFLTFVSGPVTFFESTYLPPRIGTAGQYVEYKPNTAAAVCPGYL